MKFVIYASPFDEEIGGWIVLHKLCHLLNTVGEKAFLRRRRTRWDQGLKGHVKMLTGRGYRRNPLFRTPMLPWGIDWNPMQTVTIYPEVIDGNPLNARRIVRWFLHKPGFHYGNVAFGRGEYHVGFGTALLEDVQHSPEGSFVRPTPLTIFHTPIELYNTTNAVPDGNRSGFAYCLRKASQYESPIDLRSGICIDGKSHREVSRIFKQVKYFYSLDPHTYYSSLAALCGAISIILPSPLMTEAMWFNTRPANLRYGVGFGLNDEHWSVTTRHLVLPEILRAEQQSEEAVREFARDVRVFFGL